ncbi:hypothetical protein [Amycolatopsis sp. NPDC051372]|uniref:hypothetical protein n=1 Tax=unclassified Amycolatopsis TaxID=2618356 RepID=UPI003432984F
MFAVQLDALAKQQGIRAFALHPGPIARPLQRHLSREEVVERGWVEAEVNEATAVNRVASHAVNAESAARLWRLSAELTGVDAFAG